MKKLMLKIFTTSLVLQVLFFGSQQLVRAQEMTCPPHAPVAIDIKPGDGPNTIKLSARGLLPVALLSTPDFDASQFIPEAVHFSDASVSMDMGCVGASPVRSILDDVNDDGLMDVVYFFRIQDLNLTMDSTAARLMAHGDYGSDVVHILGTDSVVVRP